MATFWIILISVLGLFVAGIVGSALHAIFKFRATPERLWAQKVIAAADKLIEQIRAADGELARAEKDHAARVHLEKGPVFERYLRSISVEELSKYPGIGPATVARLRERGTTNVAALRDPSAADIPDLGPKRTSDLKSAIKSLIRDAESRLDSGACAEGQELKRRLESLEDEFLPRIANVTQRLHVLSDQLERFRPIIKIADGVVLARFVSKEPYPGLTEKLLKSPVEQLIPPARPMTEEMASAISDSPAPVDAIVPRPPKPTRNSPPPVPKPPDLFRSALDSGTPVAADAPSAQPRLQHMRVTAEFAFAVARCDGKIARAERAAIRRHLQSTFGNEPELARHIDPLCEQYEKAAIDLDGCVDWAKRLLNVDERHQLYELAETIADASGKRTKKEVKLLERLRKGLGITTSDKRPAPASKPGVSKLQVASSAAVEPRANAADKLSTPVDKPAGLKSEAVEPSTEECRATLEIAAGISLTADLVRRQYRLLRERFDPARFESHGAEFVEVANRKLERVETAAKTLLADMNEPLEVATPPEKSKDLRENPDLDAIFG